MTVSMGASVFTEIRFWMLVIFSLVLPRSLLIKRSISRTSLLVFGVALVVMAGVDVYLLQSLAVAARLTPSLADDVVFVSELTLGLYLFPALFGGIGVNIVSHVLVRHLVDAEKRYEMEHPNHDRRKTLATRHPPH